MKRLALLVAALLLGLAAFLFFRSAPAEKKSTPAVAKIQDRESKIENSARRPPSSDSAIATALNSPATDIRRDLAILAELFVTWQTNFPREGNPPGDNAEITAALAGANRLSFRFLSPTHPAINARGELTDRWGTPFRFHALSSTQLEIRSAGPDKKFGTADDAHYAPWPRTSIE